MTLCHLRDHSHIRYTRDASDVCIQSDWFEDVQRTASLYRLLEGSERSETRKQYQNNRGWAPLVLLPFFARGNLTRPLASMFLSLFLCYCNAVDTVDCRPIQKHDIPSEFSRQQSYSFMKSHSIISINSHLHSALKFIPTEWRGETNGFSVVKGR